MWNGTNSMKLIAMVLAEPSDSQLFTVLIRSMIILLQRKATNRINKISKGSYRITKKTKEISSRI